VREILKPQSNRYEYAEVKNCEFLIEFYDGKLANFNLYSKALIEVRSLQICRQLEFAGKPNIGTTAILRMAPPFQKLVGPG